MGIGKIIGKLLGSSTSVNLQPKAGPPAPTRTGEATNGGGKHIASSLLLREEVIDSRNRLYGYRFSLRQAPESPAPDPSMLYAALLAANIPSFAQRRLAVIPLDASSCATGDHLALAAPHALFLLDTANGALDGERWLRAIHDSGSQAGLRVNDQTTGNRALFDTADVAFFDLKDSSLRHIESLARQLRQGHLHLKLAAEGVQSWAERRMFAEWGFAYCMGGFLEEKEQVEGRLDGNRLILIELLNKLRSEADLADLASIAKRDPDVAFHMLTLANSPASGLASPVSSLEQAIVVLGRERLYRWVAISMFRVGRMRDRDEALLEIALSRARFLETVSPSLSRQSRDELFLVGLLSYFDLLLGVSLAEVLSRIHLAEPVQDVLLRSQGPYGRYLMLILALEKGHTERAGTLAAALAIPQDDLAACLLSTTAWADEALRQRA